ncbi:MAG: carbamoyl-phosphate synthase large subunit [Armatimonadetes bacterium]|nr:carbamoyl-phosphate synthase large subunit [Armatimonadota bacterium]
MKPTVLVLGSGPIRIGQGIEFDYSCVHCVWTLESLGYRAIIINNNPETVSTDFDTSDGLYFEPVTLEDVLDVIAHENPMGVVVQFGGQTAINIAQGLLDAGVKILGTQPDAIALAEDRDQFEKLLSNLEIPKPPGRAVRSLDEAVEVAREIGYPVLIRPSFVLGGRAMDIIYDDAHLLNFYREAEEANPGQPVLVDKYFLGVEAEVDVISDGRHTLLPGIMQHVDRSGIHSGDSLAVYPPVSLTDSVQRQIVNSACDIAKRIGIKGIMNIQFVVVDEVAYVIEVNPRASRTVPYLSKVTGIPIVQLATRCMMGETLEEIGFSSGLWTLRADHKGAKPCMKGAVPGAIIPERRFKTGTPTIPEPTIFAVKAPVFSFQKLAMVDPSLGPEMKSTGEVLGIDYTYEAALYKALVASGIDFKPKGKVIITVRNEDKHDAVEIGAMLHRRGYQLAATFGTGDAMRAAGIPSLLLKKIKDGSPNLLDMIAEGEVSLMINTPAHGQKAGSDASRIRRACIETGVACVTSIDTAKALANALKVFEDPSLASCKTVAEYLT